jgi:hypothetical protein
MDQVLFNRLRTFVVKTLGPEFHQDLSKLVVTIMTFIETKVNSDLEGDEKLSMVLTWLTQLLGEVGINLPPDTRTLIAQFIDRICEATKGQFDINTTSTTTAQPATTATTSSTKDSDSGSLKKKKGFFKK